MRWLVGVVLVCSASCASPMPLSNTAPSAEALARRILTALERGDERQLRELAITEDEFKAHVWPHLPAARAERNLPASYLWADLRQKSNANLITLVARHHGRRFELDGVRFEGATSDYGTYRVHRGSVFLVVDAAGPSEWRVCGSLIQQDGHWKVFSYVIDD